MIYTHTVSALSHSLCIATLLTGTLSAAGLAQECATTLSPAEANVIFLRTELGHYINNPGFAGNAPVDLKVQHHIVTSTSGEQAIEIAMIDYYMDELNIVFADVAMHFCATAQIDYIIDDDIYLNGGSHYLLRQINPTSDAMDVYWTTSMGSNCGVSSYTTSPFQGIAMTPHCMGYDNVRGVFIHEVGHYFDLHHTHEQIYGFDCPEGTDCETSGDLVCDTNPSPYLGFGACVDPSDCSILANDPSCTTAPGEPICSGNLEWDPDTENFMSYSVVPCLTHLSRGQLERARAGFDAFRPELQGFNCSSTLNCAADIDGDGQVNGADLTVLLSNWNTTQSIADIDGNGIVGGGDLAILLGQWVDC